MNNNTAALKEKLELEKKTLVEELSGLGILDTATNEWRATPVREAGESEESDENDLATIAEGFEERSSMTSVLQTRWHDVTDALAKMTAGTYGACEQCNNPIEEERLHANPAARTCIAHIA